MNGTESHTFVKVEGKAGEEIPGGRFVALAYGFIFVALCAYILYVARGVARVRREMEELRRRIAAKDGGGQAGEGGRPSSEGARR